MRNRVSATLLLVATFALIGGCGRYEAPIAPEQLVSESVKELTATSDASGVLLSWKRPSNDVRGKRLRDINSYAIYRATIISGGQGLSGILGVNFEQIGSVKDPSHETLTRLQDEAEARGDIRRKVKLPTEATTFTFADKEAPLNGVVLYKIVPINQIWESGVVEHYLRVDRSTHLVDLVVAPVIPAKG